MSALRAVITVTLISTLAGAGYCQTYLMVDVTKRLETPTCDGGDCVAGHNSSSKIHLTSLLPNTPRYMKTPVNYLANGYWHIVINVIKCEGPRKGPGCTGSIRVTTSGINDNAGAYYLHPKEWWEGKPTFYKQKFSQWTDYNKFGFAASSWDKTLVGWHFGPVKSKQEKPSCYIYDIGTPNTGMTPVTFRGRVWITMDPNWVPPSNPNDPVGVQPGKNTWTTNNPLRPVPVGFAASVARGFIRVEAPFLSSLQRLTIYSLQGTIAGETRFQTTQSTGSTYLWPTRDLAPGVYSLVVESSSGRASLPVSILAR